jgi:hypothetical protein
MDRQVQVRRADSAPGGSVCVVKLTRLLLELLLLLLLEWMPLCRFCPTSSEHEVSVTEVSRFRVRMGCSSVASLAVHGRSRWDTEKQRSPPEVKIPDPRLTDRMRQSSERHTVFDQSQRSAIDS